MKIIFCIVAFACMAIGAEVPDSAAATNTPPNCPEIKSRPQVYKKIALGMSRDSVLLLLKAESANIEEERTEDDDNSYLRWKDGDRLVVLGFNKQDALWKVFIGVPGVSLGDLEEKYKKGASGICV